MFTITSIYVISCLQLQKETFTCYIITQDPTFGSPLPLLFTLVQFWQPTPLPFKRSKLNLNSPTPSRHYLRDGTILKKGRDRQKRGIIPPSKLWIIVCTKYILHSVLNRLYMVQRAKYEQKMIMLVLRFNSPYFAVNSIKCMCVKDYSINISTLIIA